MAEINQYGSEYAPVQGLEINTDGPEFFPLAEWLKGRENYKKLTWAGLLPQAMFTVAAAGLIALAILTQVLRGPGGEPGWNPPNPPVVQEQPPEEEEQEEMEEEEPESPPPTSPPPTSPPPTSPPPTTPPPTTPPPTTPPPTTPPPEIPPYNPPENDTFTAPSVSLISAKGVFYPGDGVNVDIEYSFLIGSVKGGAYITFTCNIPGWPNEFPCDSLRFADQDTALIEDSVYCSLYNSGNPETPPPTAGQSGTITMTIEYERDGETLQATYTFSFPISIGG